MLAELKNNVIAKFDKAIKDAHAKDCVVVAFHLESEEENKSIQDYAEMSGMGAVKSCGCNCACEHAYELEYEGAPIIMYVVLPVPLQHSV